MSYQKHHLFFFATWITDFFSPEVGWVTEKKTPAIEGAPLLGEPSIVDFFFQSVHGLMAPMILVWKVKIELLHGLTFWNCDFAAAI